VTCVTCVTRLGHTCDMTRLADFYLRNSNLQVKSECDYDDEDIGVADGLGSLAGLIEVIYVYVYTCVCVRVHACV